MLDYYATNGHDNMLMYFVASPMVRLRVVSFTLL